MPNGTTGNEEGFGYVGLPPRKGELDQPQTERTRELENYISRRIKGRVTIDTFQSFAPSATHTIAWDTVEEDTAGLWDQTQFGFVIPHGAEGDFVIFSRVVVDVSGAAPTTPHPFNINLFIERDGVQYQKDQAIISYDTLSSAMVYAEESLRPNDLVYLTGNNGTGDPYTVEITGRHFAIRRLI